MANYKENIVDIELTKGHIHRSFYPHALGAGDENADRFGVRVFRDGQPENLTGNCYGLFIRADGQTVTIDNGNINGNVAFLTLPAACYVVEGVFSLTIKVTTTNNTTTLRIVDGIVSRTSTDVAVDPGTVIPSIDALIEAIEDALATIPSDYTKLQTDAKYESIQSGIQIRNIENPVNNVLAGMIWTQNSINSSGEPVDNGYGIRTEKFIDIGEHYGALHCVKNATSSIKWVREFFYDEDYTFISATNINTGVLEAYDGYLAVAPDGARYVKLMLADENWGIFEDLNPIFDIFITQKTSERHIIKNLPPISRGNLQGETTAGHFIEQENRALTDYIPVGKGTRIECKKYNCVWYYWFDHDLEYGGASNWATAHTINQDCYIRIVLRHSTENEDITNEMLEDMQDWVKIHYVAPTDYRISEKRIKCLEIFDDAGLKATENILFGQVWDYDYLAGADGSEVANKYSIRTKAFVPLAPGTEMLKFDFSEYENIAGRICLYNASKTMVATKTFTSTNGSIQTLFVTVPYDAVYLRVAVTEDWATTIMLHPTFGYDVAVSAYSDEENDNDTYSNIYGSRIESATKEYHSLAEPERVGYAWLSDIHLSTNHEESSYVVFPRAMKAAAEAVSRSGADFIVLGGDIIDNESTTDKVFSLLAKAFKPLRECNVPIVWLLGNHDDNAYGTALGKAKAIALFAERSEYHNDIHFVDGYYCFDIPRKKKRIVCLNTIDYPNNKNGTNWWSLSENQVKWFCEMAVDTPYEIIILTHMLPMSDYNFYGLGDNGGYHTDLRNAISAYNSRSSITLYGTTYNFASATGTIKYIHAGHTHVEFDQDLQSIKAGGVECIVTGCMKQWNQGITENEIAVDANAGVYEVTQANQSALHYNNNGFKYYHWADRAAGEIQEALFDLVSANENTVRCIRIGAGKSRTFDIT